MTNWLANRNNRKWIYSVCMAVIPLLVAYGLIDGSQVPLWIAFLGAVISPALALTHLTPEETHNDSDD